jgi:hypothetical protein
MGRVFPALFVDGRRHFDAMRVAYGQKNRRGVLVQTVFAGATY